MNEDILLTLIVFYFGVLFAWIIDTGVTVHWRDRYYQYVLNALIVGVALALLWRVWL